MCTTVLCEGILTVSDNRISFYGVKNRFAFLVDYNSNPCDLCLRCEHDNQRNELLGYYRKIT